MTIEEIRSARLAAQEEIRGVLRKLAEQTGLSVAGVSVQAQESHRFGDERPKYFLGDVRIDLERI